MNRVDIVNYCLRHLIFAIFCALFPNVGWAQSKPIDELVADVQPKVVKLYGAGGLRRLEAYQSGVLVSADGWILSTWSHVIDGDEITAVLHTGERFSASFLGYDPQLEIAVLKIDTVERNHFLLDEISAMPGERVFAFSNLYGAAAGNEPVSVQRGRIAGLASLDARRGRTPVRFDNVLLLDAVTSNPGAAGGAVVDSHGRLLGMIGNELIDPATQCWINFALPTSICRSAIERIASGETATAAAALKDRSASIEPWTPEKLGAFLVPNVLRRTPPFVDRVDTGSRAEAAGIAVDDLVVELNGVAITSCGEFLQMLETIDRGRPLNLLVKRGPDIVSVTIQP